jgi:hypothetical protein
VLVDCRRFTRERRLFLAHDLILPGFDGSQRHGPIIEVLGYMYIRRYILLEYKAYNSPRLLYGILYSDLPSISQSVRGRIVLNQASSGEMPVSQTSVPVSLGSVQMWPVGSTTMPSCRTREIGVMLPICEFSRRGTAAVITSGHLYSFSSAG